MTKSGVVIKGVGGLYHVKTEDGVYFCKARGIFRNENISPLPGDKVNVAVIDETAKSGDLFEIMPRRNALIRPKAANVDAAVIVMAAAAPTLNFDLLDKFLLLNENIGIPQAICVNKADLSPQTAASAREIYKYAGYPVFIVSAAEKTGLDGFAEFLAGKLCALAGPSGVGKSSLINALSADGAESRATGELSAKIARGKHTTRETSLLEIFPGAFVLDTPGFTSLDISGLNIETLPSLFPEFRPFLGRCAWSDCAHAKESGCAVKDALGNGVPDERYRRYLAVLEELKERR